MVQPLQNGGIAATVLALGVLIAEKQTLGVLSNEKIDAG